MNNSMKPYYDYTVSPLGNLFYKTVWKQLNGVKDKKVLDFGSGFGFTSNYFSKNNHVTAIEIDKQMIDVSIKEKTEEYNLIHGGLDSIKDISNESFDVVICHLVLEFVENRDEILKELTRVLKKGGILSIVKHNRTGRIIQAIVQDYDLLDAKNLLLGGFSFSSAFGDIKYYENEEILNYSENKLIIKDVYGVRALASLQDAKIKSSENWLEEMFDVEWELLKNQNL